MKSVIARLFFVALSASSVWAGASVNYTYDKYGNCEAVTTKDAGGNTLEQTTYTYDAYRRVTSMTEAVPGRKWNWYYDRYFDGAGLIGASAHTSKKWRVQVEPAFNAAGDRRLSAQKFDHNDQIIEQVTGMIEKPNGDYATTPDTELHSFGYDENGNKNAFIDPRGRLTTYEYDLRNRLWKTNETVNTLPRTTETLYDTTGNKTLVKFPDQRTQQWLNHNAFGQPRQFIDERNNVTDLHYWPWGPMKKLAKVITHRVKDNGQMEDQPTEFYYTRMGRPQTTVFPDRSDEWSFYEFGQLKSFWTRKDQIKTITYDARGREISHSWQGDAAPGVSRSWDDANRVLTLCNIYSTIAYEYDGGGLVRAEKNWITGSGGQRQTIFERYADGSVSAIQYPNGLWIYRDYTARGQLKTVEDSVNGPVIDYTYFPDGKVDHADYGNGTTTVFGYDGRGMISSVQHKINATGQNLSYRDYFRDTRDRIYAFKKSTNNTSNPMENGRGDRFRYDEEGQLEEAWYNAADPANSGDGWGRYDRFHFDELGNRKGSNHVANRGWMDFTRKDNGLNQYRAWMPFSIINYDDDISGWGEPAKANGVLMQDGNITAGFNALNQPMYIWAAPSGWINFGFDPLGRCVKRWGDTWASYFYYDGWNLIQEGPSASSASRTYVHGGRVDEILQSRNATTGQAAYHHYDARGHAILLTNSSGGIMEQYEYDAFGQPYFFNSTAQPLNSSTVGNRFLFTGREWLAELKLYDYRKRLYQPELGRFMQPDPIHFAAGDFNLYRYCHNDPVNNSDPTGEFVIAAPVVGVIVVGAAGTIILSTPQGQQMVQDAGRAGLNLIRALGNALHSESKSEPPPAPSEVPKPNEGQVPAGEVPAGEGEGVQKGDRPKEGEGTDQLRGVEAAQEAAKANRPSIQEKGDWEGAKSRPKQNTIRSITKSKQRAKAEDYGDD